MAPALALRGSTNWATKTSPHTLGAGQLVEFVLARERKWRIQPVLFIFAARRQLSVNVKEIIGRQFILAKGAAEGRERSEFIISLRVRGSREPRVVLARCKIRCAINVPIFLWIYAWQWRHVAQRHGEFCVSRQHGLCRWWPANFNVLSMKGSGVFFHEYSSMKQCLQSVNHEQFPTHMTQNNKHNKWLEIPDF